MSSPSPLHSSSWICKTYYFNGLKSRRAKKGFTWLLAILNLTLFLYILVFNDRLWRSVRPVRFEVVATPETISLGERKFVVVLPADDSSHDLCKVISSAVALGYPAPIIVNWKKNIHTGADGIGPSQLGKITGTLDYLQWATGDDALEDERLGEDDLVLMLDAHDVWFQLPPSIMLHRYFSSNERANQRIAEEYNFDQDLMQQTIIAAAQKGCIAPRDKISNLHCPELPASTLPKNVYGFFTDYKMSRYKHVRPKFLNSGGFIGPAGDMRRYFQRVKHRMDQDVSKILSSDDLAGDQGIFAEVFGEQEIWRRKVKQAYFAGDNTSKEAEISARDEFEYHVGLDYTQELFYPTCYSEYDGFFVSLNSPVDVAKLSKKAGASPPRIEGVPRDISNADDPLTVLGDITERSSSWNGLPLYVDFLTTSVPATIHHNAWRGGLKNRIITWWDKTWYFPHLRNLLEARLSSNASTMLARIPANGGCLEVRSYGTRNKGSASLLFVKGKGMKSWELRATDWDTVCKSSNDSEELKSHWYDEVFRDDKGSLIIDPKVSLFD